MKTPVIAANMAIIRNIIYPQALFDFFSFNVPSSGSNGSVSTFSSLFKLYAANRSTFSVSVFIPRFGTGVTAKVGAAVGVGVGVVVGLGVGVGVGVTVGFGVGVGVGLEVVAAVVEEDEFTILLNLAIISSSSLLAVLDVTDDVAGAVYVAAGCVTGIV